jgi:hypothetical protein
MIRTLAVICNSNLACWKDDSKTVAETASNELLIGAVQALCKFSLLVSQQNQLDLSLKVIDDALNGFYQKKGIL